MYKLLALLAVSADPLHRAGLDHQRDAGRGHDDRRQQRDGRLQPRDAAAASTASSRTSSSRATAWSGFHDPDWHMDEIRRVAGDDIAGMTPTVVVPAHAQFSEPRRHWITRQVNLIGVDEATHSPGQRLRQFLQHPANREQLSFEPARERLRRARSSRGRTARNSAADAQWPAGHTAAGKPNRRKRLAARACAPVDDPDEPPIATTPAQPDASAPGEPAAGPGGKSDQRTAMPRQRCRPMASDATESPRRADSAAAADATPDERTPFDARGDRPRIRSPTRSATARRASTGHLRPGIAAPTKSVRPGQGAAYRRRAGHRAGQLSDGPTAKDAFLVLPGDDVKLTVPTAGQPPKAVDATRSRSSISTKAR